jgi:hypothetical protein
MSHLSTLITRVKRCEFAGCPEAQDCGAGEFIEQSIKERLLNIVEYLTYSCDYSMQEAKEAREILERYDMNTLIGNPKGIISFIDAIYQKVSA